MPSLADLTPAERAALLGKPEGEPGIAIGKVMNGTNAKIIDTVYRRLGLRAGQSVLEIGFGNGATVPLMMRMADRLTYTGVDIAETMVAEATASNRALVDAGRAKFHLASAEALPSPDASFDRACAVNVVYFWRDPVQVLREIRRVLRPGGLSVIAGADGATAARFPFHRAEYGFAVLEAAELVALHRVAGFSTVDIEGFDEVAKMPDGTSVPRHYHLAVAIR